MTDKAKDWQASSEIGQRIRQTAEAKALARGLLGMDAKARYQIFKRAGEVAFELIAKRMDSTDRINFNCLLACGLDPDSSNVGGDTLLIAACKAKDRETVITLRNYGAKKGLGDSDGHGAAYWAELMGHDEILEILNSQWKIPDGFKTGPKPNEFALQDETRRAAEEKRVLTKLLRFFSLRKVAS
jgi:hypothetical protein